MVARRFVMTEPCRLWVWDREPRRRKYPIMSHLWRWPGRLELDVEQEAMLGAVADGACEPIGGVRAWRVDRPPYSRVLCLTDAEAVSV